jgi:peptidoglycan/LPS O-acetylase OafA/YrhL
LTRESGKNLHHWALHVLALQPWSGNVYTAFKFNGPGWSIGVEFFLYACFPVLIVVLSPVLRSSAVDCLLLAGVVAACMSLTVVFFHVKGLASLPITDPNSAHRWLYVAPVSRLGDFVLGICAAFLFLNRRHHPPRVWVTLCCEFALVLAFLGLMSRQSIHFTAGSYDVVYAVPAAILIWFLAVQPRIGIGRLLSVPLVVALGEASYAFYLIHVPVKSQLAGTAGAGGGTFDNVVVDLMELALVTALAWGIHVGFERPARRVVRRALSRGSAAQ